MHVKNLSLVGGGPHDKKSDLGHKKSFHGGKKKSSDSQLRKDRGGRFDKKRGKISCDEGHISERKDRFFKKEEKMMKGHHNERSFEYKRRVKSFDGALKKSKAYRDDTKKSKRFGGSCADRWR